jgi:hypothetical protein
MKHSVACSAVSVIGAVWLALFPVPFFSAQVNWGMGEQVLEHVSKEEDGEKVVKLEDVSCKYPRSTFEMTVCLAHVSTDR